MICRRFDHSFKIDGCREGLSERKYLVKFGCHSERGARVYNESLGAEPQAEVQGAEPTGDQGGHPPEAECVVYFACPKETANLRHY